MTRKTLNKKRPKQVPLTFGEGEEELLRVLDHKLEKELYLTRSGWVKQKIREDFLLKKEFIWKI